MKINLTTYGSISSEDHAIKIMLEASLSLYIVGIFQIMVSLIHGLSIPYLIAGVLTITLAAIFHKAQTRIASIILFIYSIVSVIFFKYFLQETIGAAWFLDIFIIIISSRAFQASMKYEKLIRMKKESTQTA